MRAGFVGAFAVISAAILDKDAENGVGESRVGLGEAEEVMDMGDIAVDGRRRGGEGDIKGKFEFTAEGSDTADDLGTIDAAAVPSIGGTLGGFGKNCK